LEAAAWARGQLEQLGYATAQTDITVGSAKQRSHNVVADRTGNGPDPRGLVLVTAHLDSINLTGGPSAPAPGADDNGSGAAGLLEIAHVLAGHQAAHDLQLVLFGGEEEGLFGSRQYVAALSATERDRIRAVINMDMIATKNTANRSVLLEGAPLSQRLIDELAAAAGTYTSLAVQVSLHPFNSDHVPFMDVSIPAVLTIEGANEHIHTAGDTLTHIDYNLAEQIVLMNVATTVSGPGRRRSVTLSRRWSAGTTSASRPGAARLGDRSGPEAPLRRDGDEPAFLLVKIPASVTRRCEPPRLLQQNLVYRPTGRHQDWVRARTISWRHPAEAARAPEARAGDCAR
jgi:Zn-dependent M28 family amino/carboxypeptidase